MNEDDTAINYSSDPLLDARDAVPIYGLNSYYLQERIFEAHF